MPATIDPRAIYKATSTVNMPYTHCKTRIVSLVDLDIPEQATEDEYKRLYDQISRSQTPVAQALTDAISSVSLGIAPPVAFPTETVYGLGADATNKASIAGIFAAKGRPSDNPLIVHVASKEHLERLTGQPIPAVYTDLVKEHWPGPLTILIPVPTKNSVFAPNVHPGQQTIGFRVPESKYARLFIAATGKPIAAPSANSSGRPSPTTAQHVMHDLKGKINFILDGGSCDVGVESTVVDGLHNPPLILRPGGLSQDDLIAHGKKHGNIWAHVGIGYKQHKTNQQLNGTAHKHDPEPDSISEAEIKNETEEGPRAPGMKYKHYAPQGRMTLFNHPASLTTMHHELDSLILSKTTTTTTTTTTNSNSEPRLNIAILTSSTWPSDPISLLPPAASHHLTKTNHNHDHDNAWIYDTHTAIHVIHLGTTPAQIGRTLFAALRDCDDRGCQVVFAEAPSLNDGRVEEGKRYEFDAVLERMRKAASVVLC